MKKIMAIAAFAAMLVSCGGGMKGKPDFSDNEYAVRTIGSSDADLQTKYPATIKGQQDVEIRPKVSGFITRINVKEGQTVGAGQVLFEIDNVTYKAQVNQAQAALTAATSQLNTATLTYNNAQKLFAANVIGQYELDASKNTYESAKAGVAQAQAALASAKEALSFCFVTAPTSGVVGSLPYKVGALVSASSPEPLTTISNNSGLEIYFSVTEKEVLNMSKTAGSVQSAINTMPEIKLMLADGSIYNHVGKVVKASGVIDPATGSISLIAHFPNPEHLLKAGASGYVIMPHKATGAIIIPQSCVADVLNKHFVYVVGKDNKVKYTEITVDPNDDGESYIITSGLKKGDRIVVDGITSLQDGMEIKPITEAQLKQKLQKTEKLAQVQGDGVIAVGKALKGE
ncbi:MAG: efflux RND transporter periplasmic adaptor subunit [Prevotella sp.]|nr:efflux RND transporter periplasmic adaptor subunit [Candidatus Prevotella equi]